MGSSFWRIDMKFGRFLCWFRTISLQIVFITFLSGWAGAQWAPSSSYNPLASWRSSVSNLSLSSLKATDFSAGFFWGGGTMYVDHKIGAGPAPDSIYGLSTGGPAFAAFEQRRSTDLKDTYVALQGGLRYGDRVEATLYYDTNIGKQTQFKQTTPASSGQGSNFGGGRPQSLGRIDLAVLFLPDNTEGIINLDNTNRIWNTDLCLAFSALARVQVLAGWKYSSLRSSIDPYSATIPGITPLFQTLPGITNFQNFFVRFGGPSTTGFAISQQMWYGGPYIGLRFGGNGPQSGAGTGWYLEAKVAPWLAGRYGFYWAGAFNAPGAFLNGQQTTNATGLRRYALEVKGGGKVDVARRFALDVWAKYLYVNMNGSTPEVQSEQSNILVQKSLSQEAHQTVNMNVNFWGIGGDLVLPF